MNSDKQIKVSLLQTPYDFTELLDLQDLMTQSAVLKHLQNNQRTYQEKFIKSFIKTRDEVLSFIPETHWDDYQITKKHLRETFYSQHTNEQHFNESDWVNIPRMYFDTNSNHLHKDGILYGCIKFSLTDFLQIYKETDIFIVDTKRKVIISMLDLKKKYKISIDGDILSLSFSKSNISINEQHYYRITYFYLMEYEFVYTFDLKNNMVGVCNYNYRIDSDGKTHRY